MISGSLRVLHIKNYNNHEGENNPLAEFRKNVRPFAPMTCARHVYIFFDDREGTINGLLSFLNKHATHCEYLSGIEAYDFLLRWFIGAESRKIKGNDHFVLGKIREDWTSFCKQMDVAVEMINMLSQLFKDAKNIRSRIQSSTLNPDSIRETLILMAKNCTKSRSLGQTPAYDMLLTEMQEYLAAAETEFYIARFAHITKSISALNLRAEDSTLLPSAFKSDQKSPLVAMFKRNHSLTLEKMQLYRATMPILDENSSQNTVSLHI